MSSLAEIEQAADALSAQDQEILLRHLSQKLRSRANARPGSVAPPSVPMEELQRIHALIEAEFSHIDTEGW
jgi:hypothetical protein